MKMIRVSDATYRAIAETAILPFRSTGTRQADGSWHLSIDDEICERLRELRQAGETDDDVIVRMLYVHHGRKPN